MREERLNSLLLAWQEQQLRGRDVSAAELCRDCSELAAELSQRIQVLRQMNGLLQPPDPPPASDTRKVPLPSIDEASRQRFKAAWRDGRAEPIERYLPPAGDPRHLATLEELVHIELEFAWRAAAEGQSGRPPTVEAYLARFPQLCQGAVLRRLLQQEYRVRHRYGDAPPADEYQARFPECAPLEVPTLVAAPGSSRGPGPPPPQLPGYEIRGELGRGGMGVVYKARDLRFKDRTVALKMIRATGRADPEYVTRFRAEAEALARVQHPNIVQIFTVEEHDGTPFIVMEFVAGGSLMDRVNGRPQPPRDAAAVVEVLARALYAAHEKGIIHRDLKPANVLLAPCTNGDSWGTAYGLPKVTDFGLARQSDGGLGQTATNAALGTPAYMAPEQTGGRAQEIGPATDVYGLGAILYELLSGRPPFRGEDLVAVLMWVRTEPPAPPRQLQPDVPADLEAICLRCLAKAPADRYASARELADDLRRFLNGEPTRTRHAPPDGRLPWRWVAVGSMVALLLAVVAAGLGLRRAPPAGPTVAGAAPLRAEIDGLVWESAREHPFVPGNRRRQRLSLREAVPLTPRDYVRFEIRLNRPAYLYLVWLDTEGRAMPLYPWREDDWQKRPDREEPRDRLSEPASADGMVPLAAGPPGIEVVLLLARDAPLTAAEHATLVEVLSRPRAWTRPTDLAVAVWLEDGERRASNKDRGPPVAAREAASGDPELQVRGLAQQLRTLFPYSRAVCFGNGGK
jgi:hypothetical protein